MVLFSSSPSFSRAATSAPKIPSSSSKKNKYVLKERRKKQGGQHASSSGGPSRPTLNLRSPQPYETTRAVHCDKSPRGQAAASSSRTGKYVVQKRPRLTSKGGKAGASSVVWAPSQQKETKLAAGPSDVQQADAIGSDMRMLMSTPGSQALVVWKPKGEALPTDGRMETEHGQLDGHSNNLRRETKPAVDLPVSYPRAVGKGLKAQAVTTANRVVKKEKPRKRVRDDVGSVGPDDTGGIKKKKKTKVLGVDAGLFRNEGESYGKLAGKSIDIGLGHGQIGLTESQRRDDGVVRTSDLNSAAARQPSVDMSSLNLEFPQLLSDLRELAADPFYAIERNVSAAVLQVFGKFRMQVYKTPLHPPESEHDMAKLQTTRVAASRSLVEPGAGNADMGLGKETKDLREPSSSALKPVKPRLNPDDQTKAGYKRGPSDLQVQPNEKKVKKMNQIKVPAVEKKAGISLKIPEGQQRKKKKSNTATETASASLAKPNNKGAGTVKKQEPTPPPPPPLPFSPTALLLKFSPGTSLPSVAKLKASFVVFGPLVKDTTRIYWKSNSCRVTFEHKHHAQAAFNYASKNDLLLGPFRCYIRELDPATLKPLSNIPGTLPPPQSRPSGGPDPLVAGNGDQPQALPHQQQRASTGQLKSILKKPGDEGGGSAGDAAREPLQRVMFTQDGRDKRVEPTVVPAATNGSGGSHAARLSSSTSAARFISSSRSPRDPRISKNPKSSGLLPTPPLPPLHAPFSNPPHAMEKQRLLPPPPRPPSISLPPAPPPPSHVAGDRLPYISLPPPSHVAGGGRLPPPPPPPNVTGGLYPSISPPPPPPPHVAAGRLPSSSLPPPPHIPGARLPSPLPPSYVVTGRLPSISSPPPLHVASGRHPSISLPLPSHVAGGRLSPPPPPPHVASGGRLPSISLPPPSHVAGALIPSPPPPSYVAGFRFPSISSAPPPYVASGRLTPPPPLPHVVGGRLPSISLPSPPHVTDGRLLPPPPAPHIVGGFEARGPGPAQFNHPRPQHSGQHMVGEGRHEPPDISNQMLILLIRCSEIVANIQSSLGYVPYHPL